MSPVFFAFVTRKPFKHILLIISNVREMFEKPRSVPPKKFSFLVFSSVAFVFVRFDIVFIRYRFDSIFREQIKNILKKAIYLSFFLVSTLPPERSLINPSGVDVRR